MIKALTHDFQFHLEIPIRFEFQLASDPFLVHNLSKNDPEVTFFNNNIFLPKKYF